MHGLWNLFQFMHNQGNNNISDEMEQVLRLGFSTAQPNGGGLERVFQTWKSWKSGRLSESGVQVHEQA